MSHGESSTRSRRRHLRVPVVVAIVADDGSTAYAMNLSAGGVCLQTREALEIGRRIELRFRMPGEKLITVRAEVAWADCDAARAPGVGLRYCECGLRFVTSPSATGRRSSSSSRTGRISGRARTRRSSDARRRRHRLTRPFRPA